MSNLIIPYELIFYVPNRLKEGLEDEYKSFNIFPALIGSAKDTTDKRTRKKLSAYASLAGFNRYNAKANEVEETVMEVKVRNEGFKLSLPPANFPYTQRSIDYRIPQVSLIVTSPALEQAFPGRNIAILVDTYKFVELISQQQNIVRGNFGGTFCFTPNASLYSTEVYLDDPRNEDIQKAKEVGSTMSKKLTSKWIPGHMYVKKNGEKLLYLGEYSDIAIYKRPWQYTHNHALSDNVDIIKNGTHARIEKGRIYCPLYNENKVKELEGLKGTSLITFLKNNILDHRDYYTEIRNNAGAPITAADLGEYLTYDPSVDLNVTLKQMALQNIGNPVSLKAMTELQTRMLVFVPSYINDTQHLKKEYIDIKKTRLIGLANEKERYYYSSSGNNIVYDRSNIENHYKVGQERDLIRKTFVDIPDDEYNAIIDEVLKILNSKK